MEKLSQYKIDKRNREYWEKRKISTLKNVDIDTNKALKKIEQVYTRSLAGVEKEIALVMNRLTNPTTAVLDLANNISLSGKEANKYFNVANSLLKQLEKTGNSNVLALQLRVQGVSELNRLNALKNLINLQLGLASSQEEKILTEHLESIYSDGHRNATQGILVNSDVQYNSNFVSIDQETVKRVVAEPWNNKHYSSRIWTNNYEFVDTLSKTIEAGVLQGKTIFQMSSILEDKFNVKYYQSDRLIRTETAYFIEDSNKSAYLEMGVEQYQYIATLDNRTTKQCQELDNNIYRYDQAEVGVNFPPKHVSCRSTTAPYFEGTELESTRIARNLDGENIYISSNVKAKDYNQIFK
jgi:SPP1 gp7 family putative phage head morphogenesis protein